MTLHISKEFKIGLFGVVAITVLYLGFNYLKGEDFFKDTRKYYAVYENIDGLTVSNSVFIKGYTVGRVSNIFFQQEKGRIVVELDIDGNVVLGDSTIANLRNESFLGGKSIDLKIPEKIHNPLEEGDTIHTLIALGVIESFQQSTLPVADDIGALVRRFNSILESFQTTELEIRKMVIQIQTTMHSADLVFTDNRKGLKKSMANIQDLTYRLDEASKQLNPLLTKVNTIADSVDAANLAETIKSLRMAALSLNTLLHNMNEGQGTMGKLMRDDSLYVNLNRSAADLDKLLIDLREHPKRYVHVSVFGKSDKK